MAFEQSSSTDTADFTEGIQKYDCFCNEFSKDLYKNKYTKMNCWRNVADKFGMSPEDAEKKVKDICLFFLSDHGDHMETSRSLRSLGSPASLNQFFSDSGDPSDPSDYMETGLKEQWGR